MNDIEVCIIGHITRDINVVRGVKKEMPGGAGYYATMALQSLNLKTSLVTKISPSDHHLLQDFQSNVTELIVKDSRETMVFENQYNDDLSTRRQRVKTLADPFTVEDIPRELTPRFYHLGPLTKRDIPGELIEELAEESRVSMDVQGFVRSIVQGEIVLNDWEEKTRYLPYITILKASYEEAQILTREDEPISMAKKLSSLGAQEVIITMGEKGSLIYAEDSMYLIPSFSPRVYVDPTGCGDTYIAGYLYMRSRTNDFYEIGRFSSAMATLKLEYHGAFHGTLEDIHCFLSERRGGV